MYSLSDPKFLRFTSFTDFYSKSELHVNWQQLKRAQPMRLFNQQWRGEELDSCLSQKHLCLVNIADEIRIDYHNKKKVKKKRLLFKKQKN